MIQAAARVLSEDEEALNAIVSHLMQSKVISTFELRRALRALLLPESRGARPGATQGPRAR